MSKVITFSRHFPAYHPRKGEPTYFVEGILTQLGMNYKTGGYFKWLIDNNPDISEVYLMKFFDSLKRDVYPKSHTIRNHKRHAIVGGLLNPKCWAGKPYHKTPEGFWQIKFAPDIEIKKVWDVNFRIKGSINFRIVNHRYHFDHEKMKLLAKNDGLSYRDFMDWFCNGKDWDFSGQIICWNENITY